MPLGQRPGDNSEARYCGAEIGFSDDIQNALAFALAGSFDFLISPLVSLQAAANSPSSRKQNKTFSPGHCNGGTGTWDCICIIAA